MVAAVIDPITISMAVAPMLLSTAKLVMIVSTVKDSYKSAPAILIATSAEFKLMHVALCKIQRWYTGMRRTCLSD